MDTAKTTILDSLLGMGAFRDNTGTLRPPQIEEINLNQSITDFAEFDDSAYNDAHFRFIETGVNMFDIDNDAYDSLIAEFGESCSLLSLLVLLMHFCDKIRKHHLLHLQTKLWLILS